MTSYCNELADGHYGPDSRRPRRIRYLLDITPFLATSSSLAHPSVEVTVPLRERFTSRISFGFGLISTAITIGGRRT
jgi:hypothetical protein